MTEYSCYSLEHVYRRSFREGGLTIQQVHALFEHLQKRKLEDLKFQCRVHGIDPDAKQSSTKSQMKQQEGGLPLFQDPLEYDNMNKEEKDKLTKRMMGQHNRWSKGNMSTLGS